jgi:hypothetical protein
VTAQPQRADYTSRGPLRERRLGWRAACRRDSPGWRTIDVYLFEVVATCHARRYERRLFVGLEPGPLGEFLAEAWP